MYLTIYHNAAVQPKGPSIKLDVDPSPWLGEPYAVTGGITTWYVGEIVIVLSVRNLTG